MRNCLTSIFLTLLCSCIVQPIYKPVLIDISAVPERNTYPIVLVHGLMGFGRDEGFGYRYWGGTMDLEQELRSRGFDTHTAVVGPFSSNWDRACELYAFIKGGRVDYGQAHARRFGHERFGHTFPGLYPEWGDLDPQSGDIKRIHLLTHSMGGQTARTLVQLLEQGSQEEIAAAGSNRIHPLFSGDKSLVHSVTTISSPHNGTTLIRYPDLEIMVQHLISLLVVTEVVTEEPFIDLKLGHWGLHREAGETPKAYQKRILSHSLWDRTKDVSKWDLSPEGAAELNRWVQTQPEVFYFSWATEKTSTALFSRKQIPELGMNPGFKPFARFMGSYIDPPMIDDSWWPNDGIVNTVSMIGPTRDSTDRIVPYSGAPLPGVWNFMGLVESMDHIDILGIPVHTIDKPPGSESLLEWYLDWAAFLKALPRRPQ